MACGDEGSEVAVPEIIIRWNACMHIDLHILESHSFVPYYAQRISFSIVMNGAKSILKTLAKASRSRLRSAA